MPLAAVMTAPHKPIEVQNLPAAVVEPGGLLLETIFSEVCGTDVHLHNGHLAGVPYPIIPGHVSVGKVIETGGAVNDIDGNSIAVGSVVTFLDVHETCDNCTQSAMWYRPKCKRRSSLGVPCRW